MTLRSLLIVTLATTLVACVDDDGAPEGAQLLAPERVEVNWDEGFNALDDGVGAMIPVDLMVYEGTTGEPLEAIDLALSPSGDSIALIQPDDIDVLTSSCGDCVWDSMRDRYIDWRQGTRSVQTDSDGLARVYVWVDRFPIDEPVFFDVEMGSTTVQVDILEEDPIIDSAL